MKNFLSANWRKLIMANYAVNPEVLSPFLPKHTELDLHNGKAYVSLVGFLFLNSRIFGVPIPFMGSFEEVNLRFYVKRKINGEWRRGVVFVNETVPYHLVATIANWLYKEHYTAVPTKHSITKQQEEQVITYSWQKQKEWNSIQVTAGLVPATMHIGSDEAFIFEHYFGYTKVNEHTTIEYSIAHPSWEVYPVKSYHIQCNFAAMYGDAFSCLQHITPDSVMLAEGSAITVQWKREKLI